MPPPNGAWRDGFTHYPPRQGDPQLREAIAAYHSRLSAMPISPAEVLVTAGGTGAISAAMLALLNPGDEVLIMDPCYLLYADVARVVGATVVHVPLTVRFRVDLDGVRRALSGRTRMLVLNYPSNPTGQLLQPAELDGLAGIAVERDLAVVSDEVYDQLVFEREHRSALAHPVLAGRVVLVNSCSKTYAMTGWRIGWAVAPQEVIRPVLTMNRSVLGWPNAIAQRAALEALTNAPEDRK